MSGDSCFFSIAQAYAVRYPLMEPQDYVKLAFQSEFGAEHMIQDVSQAERAILEEWTEIPATESKPPEPIGNGLCRFHFTGDYDPERAAPLLAKLFSLTAQKRMGSMEGLLEKLERLRELSIPGMSRYLEEYRRQGCPPVHHSERFREAYSPHYRLLRRDLAGFFPALMAVWKLVLDGKAAIVAIDGRCGGGKTQFAELIARLFPCRVLHMDDFYLPLEQRGMDWRETPAGNMDLARFLEEALLPARDGKEIICRAYDCRSGELKESQTLPDRPLTVVEGSYSQHPELAEHYALKIFLTCSAEEQASRLKAREGDYFQSFTQTWIPLEERYLQLCEAEQKSDVLVDTTNFFD